MKKRFNKKKNNVNIKKDDKMLLFTRNLTNNKLNNFYVKTFIVKNVRDITILLTLLNTKTFSRFHTLTKFKKKT